jgi:Arylsulfotransferase (ASST)
MEDPSTRQSGGVRRRRPRRLRSPSSDPVETQGAGGTPPAPGRRLTRREALLAGGAGIAALGLGASGGNVLSASTAAGAAPQVPGYLSRPDLRLPGLAVAPSIREPAPGLLLLAPYNAPNPAQAGALIVDDDGRPVWEQPLTGLVTTDLRVQHFRGEPMLTWWQGLVRFGHGVGRYVVADSSYTPVAHLNAGNGRQGDLHEFLLTDRGTALLTTYEITTGDLREVGGARDGAIQDAIFQEIDVGSGAVLMEWHSRDHIPISESYWPVGGDWDYVHLNSIAVDHDQNLLVSSRNTHTIYKIDRRTGQIIWRLGGKRSDFAIDAEAAFAWQHDARRQPDGSITLFDNGERRSRALVLEVDEASRRARLRRQYTHPAGLFANSQGNVQVLPDGNVLVGWGAQPYVSEFTAGGELIFDARFAPGYISYRAYRMPWAARPPGAPAVVARRSRRGVDIHVSWNGDTRVNRWTVLAGATGKDVVATVARTGFETVIGVTRAPSRLRVTAIDRSGRVLATSAPVAA